MHPWITDIVVQFGIPIQTVLLLLLFPVIATLVAFLRQVFGVRAFGIYTPTIIALVFFMISDAQYERFAPLDMAYNLRYGIAIYIAVIALAIGTRAILHKIRLLYLPRVAITMTLLSFAMLGILMIGAYFQRTGFATVYVFPLIMLVVIAEKFVAVQIEKGTRFAAILAAETLVVALVGYMVLSLQWTQNAVLAMPYLVLFTIPFNILLGKWTGLRLTEYVRFRDVLMRMK